VSPYRYTEKKKENNVRYKYVHMSGLEAVK